MEGARKTLHSGYNHNGGGPFCGRTNSRRWRKHVHLEGDTGAKISGLWWMLQVGSSLCDVAVTSSAQRHGQPPNSRGNSLWWADITSIYKIFSGLVWRTGGHDYVKIRYKDRIWNTLHARGEKPCFSFTSLVSMAANLCCYLVQDC